MAQIAGAVAGFVAGLIIGLILPKLLAILLRLQWNATLPEVLGVKQISLLKSINILLIASILFGEHRALAVQQVPVEQNVAKSANATTPN
jgi:hypothetical protein